MATGTSHAQQILRQDELAASDKTIAEYRAEASKHIAAGVCFRSATIKVSRRNVTAMGKGPTIFAGETQ